MDLFNDRNPRLDLKPVVIFNKYLRTVFLLGRCECGRCKDAGYDDSAFKPKHNIEIDGLNHMRRFAISLASDTAMALENAWESFYQASMDLTDMSLWLKAVQKFTDESNLRYLLPVLIESGYAEDTDGELRVRYFRKAE